jgi:hypothetical protein
MRGESRQMGLATTMYINEWRHYPGCWGTNSAGNVFAVWPTRLRKYMKGNQAVFRCPSRDVSLFEWKTSTSAPAAGLAETGYGYNVGESLLIRDAGFFSYGYNDWGAGRRPAVRFSRTQRPRGSAGLGGDVYVSGGRELKASRVRKAAEMIEITDRNTEYPSAAIAYRYKHRPARPLRSARAGP